MNFTQAERSPDVAVPKPLLGLGSTATDLGATDFYRGTDRKASSAVKLHLPSLDMLSVLEMFTDEITKWCDYTA